VWGCDTVPDSVWNITDSQTPGCIEGECDDDDYPSLAEEIYGGNLHVFFVNDKYAGAVVNEEPTATDNPVLYLRHVKPQGGVAEGEEESDRSKVVLGLRSYPNPFQSRCVVSYSVPRSCRAKVYVYDLCGRLVRVLVNGEVDPGMHEARWDGCDGSGASVGSGLYFCRMVAGTHVLSQKMVVMR
jgi:hypothetical protein